MALCEARFYFRRVKKRFEPQNKYAAWGTIGHSYAERWLKYGELPPAPKDIERPKTPEEKVSLALLAGIPHLPPPGIPGFETESEYHYNFEGVRFVGYKDYAYPGPPVREWPWSRRVAAQTWLGDHKFVGSFDYVPAHWDLAISSQPTLSAWDDVRRGAKEVYGNWVYMQRGVRAAKPVRFLLRAEQVYDRMRFFAERGRKILHMLQHPPDDPKVLHANPDACHAFGGPCPHLDICHVNQEARFFIDLLGGNTNMLQTALDSIYAQATGAPAAWTPAPALPPPPAPTEHMVSWNGQQHRIPVADLARALAAGATDLGAVVVAPPPAPAPNPGVAVNPAPWVPAMAMAAPIAPAGSPMTASAASPAAPATGTQRPPGRRKNARAEAAPVPAGQIDYRALAEALLDALVERCSAE